MDTFTRMTANFFKLLILMGCFAEVDCVTVLPLTAAINYAVPEGNDVVAGDNDVVSEDNDALCSGRFLARKMFAIQVYSLTAL